MFCNHEKFIEYRLNHSARGNSFGREEAEAIHEVLNLCEKTHKGFLLSSTGRFFCAGGNVKEYAADAEGSKGREINQLIRTHLERLQRTLVPTLALVQGDCFGGGVEVISCFDKVISAPQACFGLWQRRVGLTFGWGGGGRLSQRMSVKTLIQLGLDTRVISAECAYRYGLVDQVIDKSQFQSAAERWFARQQSLPQTPLKCWKGDVLNHEVEAFEGLWFNPEHRRILQGLSRPTS